MRIALKNQAIEIKNSEVCTVTEYPIGDGMIDFAIAKITGRYPNERYVLNQKCKEIVYIQEGGGRIVIDEKEHLLNTGDVVLIEAGEKYFWEGAMTLFISCTPAFTPDQHQIVD